MIDIWLIFNLCLPFIEVLLHTYIEMVSTEDTREINHHGAALTVEDDWKKEDQGKSMKAIPNNTVKVTHADNYMKKDKEETNARSWMGEEQHLSGLNKTIDQVKRNNNKKLKMAKQLTFYFIPIMALSFVVGYWTIGLIKNKYPH